MQLSWHGCLGHRDLAAPANTGGPVAIVMEMVLLRHHSLMNSVPMRWRRKFSAAAWKGGGGCGEQDQSSGGTISQRPRLAYFGNSWPLISLFLSFRQLAIRRASLTAPLIAPPIQALGAPLAGFFCIIQHSRHIKAPPPTPTRWGPALMSEHQALKEPTG